MTAAINKDIQVTSRKDWRAISVMNISNRLKTLRKKRGLTQKELAALVAGGLDYTYIGKIERGDQLPSLKILMKIGEALNVPVAYFLEEEETAEDFVSARLRRHEQGREFLHALTLLHDEDIPLLTEIIHALARHRRTDSAYEPPPDERLLAAERRPRYRKRQARKK